MTKTGHRRFKPFLHLLLSCGGDGCQGPPMEGIDGGDDLETAFVMAKFARELEQAFVRLDAAVGKETFSRTDEFDQSLRETALRRVIIKIGNVHQLARLLDQRLGNRGRSVPERADRNATAQVEIPFARDIPKLAADAVAEH